MSLSLFLRSIEKLAWIFADFQAFAFFAEWLIHRNNDNNDNDNNNNNNNNKSQQ